jgi:galactoside O-acetyltransferase
MVNSFYTSEEINQFGFKSVGTNVLVSRFAQFYGIENIEIGNNVRIDDFCIISSSFKITINNFIHIGAFTSILGAGEVFIDDFASISGRVSIYSSSDNYAGLGMTNPMIPDEYRKVEKGNILLQRHSLIGAGAVILPNTTLEEGAVIGALSLAQGHFNSYKIYSGIPAKELGNRIDTRIKKYERMIKNQENDKYGK